VFTARYGLDVLYFRLILVCNALSSPKKSFSRHSNSKYKLTQYKPQSNGSQESAFVRNLGHTDLAAAFLVADSRLLECDAETGWLLSDVSAGQYCLLLALLNPEDEGLTTPSSRDIFTLWFWRACCLGALRSFEKKGNYASNEATSCHTRLQCPATHRCEQP
jgi:hypothetical protein